jgi:hypothetical protein
MAVIREEIGAASAGAKGTSFHIKPHTVPDHQVYKKPAKELQHSHILTVWQRFLQILSEYSRIIANSRSFLKIFTFLLFSRRSAYLSQPRNSRIPVIFRDGILN